MDIVRLSILILSLSILSPDRLTGQPRLVIPPLNNPNAIQNAVPFLMTTPDARAGSLGDAGVASLPDINSQHWNPAKYAFMEERTGVAFSYTPWLRKLINDANLFYASGFYRIDAKQLVSASIRYFSLGDIYLVSGTGPLTHYQPREMAVDAAYSRKISERWSGALALRYIYSDLTGPAFTGTGDCKPATAIAGDLAFYHTRDMILFRQVSQFSLGLNLSNMGSKIYYSDKAPGIFIPINMRIGGALTIPCGQQNSFSVLADLNKLMVPTPPQYAEDGHTILYGKDPNVPVLTGMIRSFWDAPGVFKDNGERSVLLEELHEITCSFGAEYWYQHFVALRTGYFNEHETKGNRKYFTIGAGLHLDFLGIDFNYLLPARSNSPFVNTFRLTATIQPDRYLYR